eukprot:13011-Pelagococcus_subviridis.AAC.2
MEMPYSSHFAAYFSTRRPMPAFARPMRRTRAPRTMPPAAAPSGAEKEKSPAAGEKLDITRLRRDREVRSRSGVPVRAGVADVVATRRGEETRDDASARGVAGATIAVVAIVGGGGAACECAGDDASTSTGAGGREESGGRGVMSSLSSLASPSGPSRGSERHARLAHADAPSTSKMTTRVAQ